MFDADELESRIRQAMRDGDHAGAAALARTLTTRAPERHSGWHYHALTLMLDRRPETVYHRLLPLYRARGGDVLVFLKDIFLELAWRKAYDLILNAAAAAPPRELFALVPSYFAACVLLVRGEWEAGFALLSGFRTRCLENLSHIPLEDGDGFGVLFRQALLVNDHHWLEDPSFAANLAASREQLGPLGWTVPPAGDLPAAPVVVVSCDQRYGDLFLARFFESADRFFRDRQFHLHVIDPEPDGLARLPRPRHNRLAVTTEFSGPLRSSAYYASARFIRAPELLARYRRDLMIFDVDVALAHPPELLEPAMAGCDFGSFRMDRLDPASWYQASVTVWRPTPAGEELAALVRDLILSKLRLQGPLLWMIDQAALFSAIYILGERAGRLKVADFSRRLGIAFEDFLISPDGSIDKFALMNRVSGADAQGRPHGA